MILILKPFLRIILNQLTTSSYKTVGVFVMVKIPSSFQPNSGILSSSALVCAAVIGKKACDITMSISRPSCSYFPYSAAAVKSCILDKSAPPYQVIRFFANSSIVQLNWLSLAMNSSKLNQDFIEDV